MGCLKITYQPQMQVLRTRKPVQSHEAKVVQCWFSVDPLAEKYAPISPYAYVANNPLIYIDPDGRDIWEVNTRGRVDNSWQATKHYLFGDGSPARIGPNTTNSLLNSPQFLKAHRGIINGQSSQSGKFTVDMTKRVFHIGRTNVSYSIAPGGHSVTYKLYDGDGFWDPDFIDEKYLGPSSPYFRPDGPGPNLERLGGTPYYYIPTIITFPF